MAVTIHGTNGITFNDASTQASSANPPFPGATLSANLIGSTRASGTTYTNSSTKPLCVYIAGTNAPANGHVGGQIDGKVVRANGYGSAWGVMYIVPAGKTYGFTQNSVVIEYWYEW